MYVQNKKNTSKTAKYAVQLSSGNYAVQDSTLSNLCNYKYIRASAIQDSSYKNAGYGLDQMNWP